jgi:hypothetical protein
MIVSLNEIETTALKAARGAGYPWGLAEEAGKACRWLAEREERDFGWLAPLYAILQAPPPPGSCPIARGAALADDPGGALPAGTTGLGVIHAPGLVIPFLVSAACTLGEPLLLSAEGLRFRASPGEEAFECRSWTAVAQPSAVTITRGGPMPLLRLLKRKGPGVAVSAQYWRFLDPFVARTYVPESESSRLKGAGAGLLDND